MVRSVRIDPQKCVLYVHWTVDQRHKNIEQKKFTGLESVEFSLFWCFGSIERVSKKMNETVDQKIRILKIEYNVLEEVYNFVGRCFAFKNSNRIHSMRFILNFVTNEIFIFILLFKYILCNCGMCTKHGHRFCALWCMFHIFHQKTNACQTFQGCHLNMPTAKSLSKMNENWTKQKTNKKMSETSQMNNVSDKRWKRKMFITFCVTSTFRVSLF